MEMPLCPDCEFSPIILGEIPQCQSFAGRLVPDSLERSDLYKCRNCTLGFRWPILRKESLDNLYFSGSDDAWNNAQTERFDWRFAANFVRSKLPRGNRILDLGCYMGDFLSSIATDYECAGVEINSAAVRSACSRGIDIIGNDFTKLVGSYNCITAFDVIEHVESPRAFLENCLKHVVPGGYIIVSTGNFESFTFELMKSKYWYAVVPEHIAFIAPSWFRKLTCSLSFEIIDLQFFSRRNGSLITKIRESMANLLYKFLPNLFAMLRRLGFGNIKTDGNQRLILFPPGWGSAIDHFIIVLRRI